VTTSSDSHSGKPGLQQPAVIT